MATQKLSDKELLHYINFALNGNSYTESVTKGDSNKKEKLLAEIDATGKHRVTFDDVLYLVSAIISKSINPHFTIVDDGTLLIQTLLKSNVSSLDKEMDLLEELHKNGDLSDKSYDYIKEHNLKLTDKDFKKAANKVKDMRKDMQGKLSKTQQSVKEKQAETNKKTVAKGKYDSNKDTGVINLNNYRK